MYVAEAAKFWWKQKGNQLRRGFGCKTRHVGCNLKLFAPFRNETVSDDIYLLREHDIIDFNSYADFTWELYNFFFCRACISRLILNYLRTWKDSCFAEVTRYQRCSCSSRCVAERCSGCSWRRSRRNHRDRVLIGSSSSLVALVLLVLLWSTLVLCRASSGPLFWF